MSDQCRLTVCYTGPILTQYVRNMQHREPMTISFKVIELGNLHNNQFNSNFRQWKPHFSESMGMDSKFINKMFYVW